MKLPSGLSIPEFNAFRAKTAEWLPAVHEVCAAHGMDVESIGVFGDGSNLVASTGESVVKIFPPLHRHQWESEWRVLDHLWKHGLKLPIPRLLAKGERDDRWTYVILSKVPGLTLESVWARIPADQQAELLREIGRMMAQVHAVPVGELLDLEPEWSAFLKSQREKFLARHQRLGMPDWFLKEAVEAVAAQLPGVPLKPLVILTGEYTPFNLLVEESGGHYRICGMIDFGDAMIGLREYDYLGPLLFLCAGRPELADALFRGYGEPNPAGDPALRSRLVLLAILHRYSHLQVQVRIDGWLDRTHRLTDLERVIFEERARH